jgi:hypothetical protein
MGFDEELAWDIVCHLYPNEEENAVTIANSLEKHRSDVNRVLYKRQNLLFSKRTTQFSAKPLWSLTQDSLGIYEKVHGGMLRDNIDEKLPMFCDDCGSLHPDHTPVCSKFSLGEYKQIVPSKVNYGKEMGLPGFFGIKYSENDSLVSIKNRRDVMLEFLVTIFVSVDSNKTYVNSYGIPRDNERRNALINHLQGTNVPAPPRIQELRNQDIDWLINLDLSKDLP